MRKLVISSFFQKNQRFFSSCLYIFPGQGVQKPGMILPYLKPQFSALLKSFDEALNSPVKPSLISLNFSIIA